MGFIEILLGRGKVGHQGIRMRINVAGTDEVTHWRRRGHAFHGAVNAALVESSVASSFAYPGIRVRAQPAFGERYEVVLTRGVLR